MRKHIQWKNNRKYPTIKIKRGDIAHYNEVNQWLDDNEICFWSEDYRYYRVFYFDNETDAIAFTLRWA